MHSWYYYCTVMVHFKDTGESNPISTVIKDSIEQGECVELLYKGNNKPFSETLWFLGTFLLFVNGCLVIAY